MEKTIVCVSAFGFADTVVINGSSYSLESALPSVVIEDHNNRRSQLFIYDSDATFERTGMGLYETKCDELANRTPVALLWQELKYIAHDYERKQRVANSLAKYIIQLIAELWPQPSARASADASGAAAALAANTGTGGASGSGTKAINKAFLQSNCQLVLCIPDNFDEAEQQALLNAFSGFEIQLLWRSIATLLGYFNGDATQVDAEHEPLGFPDIAGSASLSATATAHVLYVGPDSIDLSSYDLKLHRDAKYVIPVRRKPVYTNCASGTSFLHYALSYAEHFLKTNSLIDEDAEAFESYRLYCLALLSQLIYQFPEVWGQNEVTLSERAAASAAGAASAGGGVVLEEPPLRALHIPDRAEPLALGQWVEVRELLDADTITEVHSSPDSLESFYELFDFNAESLGRCESDRMDFISWLKRLMKQNEMQLDNPLYRTGSECLILTGPMIKVLDEACDAFFLVKSAVEQMHLRFAHSFAPWNKMAEGGFIYQTRLNRADPDNVPTYLDRLNKLSMVISNSDRTAYQEEKLIEEKEVPPQETLRNEIRLSIGKSSDHIELYVSSDPRFNDESINLATTESFKAQGGISVQKGTLYFSSGRKAQQDEKVRVVVEQRALSGYVKLHIIPIGESSVLPPQGETQTFDPNKKVNFEGTLPQLAMTYPPLVRPNFMLNSSVRSWTSLTREHTIFNSSTVSQKLCYYNGKFASDGIKRLIQQRLSADKHDNISIAQLISGRKDYDAFVTRLKECLPFTNVALFGDSGLNSFFYSIEVALQAALNEKDPSYLTGMRNKLFKHYCDFVQDQEQEVTLCCKTLVKFAPFNSLLLQSAISLIENHPISFSPNSKGFCLERKFARSMIASAYKILEDLKQQADSGTLKEKAMQNCTVVGSRMLSIALKAMMYSLLYRKKEADFITEGELAALDQLLDTTLQNYDELDSYLKTHDFTQKIYPNRIRWKRTTPQELQQQFTERFSSFVESKLKKLLPEVKKYLHKQGSNPNIMAEIQDLNEEEDE